MTEAERIERLKDLWERSADKAIESGFPEFMVAQALFSAGVAMLAKTTTADYIASALGSLAYEYNLAAGDPLDMLDADAPSPKSQAN